MVEEALAWWVRKEQEHEMRRREGRNRNRNRNRNRATGREGWSGNEARGRKEGRSGNGK